MVAKYVSIRATSQAKELYYNQSFFSKFVKLGNWS